MYRDMTTIFIENQKDGIGSKQVVAKHLDGTSEQDSIFLEIPTKLMVSSYCLICTGVVETRRRQQ